MDIDFFFGELVNHSGLLTPISVSFWCVSKQFQKMGSAGALWFGGNARQSSSLT